MRFLIGNLFLMCFVCLCTTKSFGQSAVPYFSATSRIYYANDIEHLKKLPVAKFYANSKQQKAFAETVMAANEFAWTALENNAIIYDTLLLNKCYRIITKLKNANPAYPFDSVKLYINRSPVANAMCVGESGTVFVNLGILLWIDNDDELAFILGHEYAHFFMNHFRQAIDKNIAIISSDDFQDELKSLKRSHDGKYERFKSLMKDLKIETGKHSRYKESEADSLSGIFITRANFDLHKAAKVLIKLDHVDDVFKKDSIYFVKDIFKGSLPDSYFYTSKKYNGLSAFKATMTADASTDTVKTHPDCDLRYVKLINGGTLPTTNCCTQITNEQASFKERALAELVRNLYESDKLTLCIHYCIIGMKSGNTKDFYHNLLITSLSKIVLADKRMNRFVVTNSDAVAGSTLKELQDFIFKTNGENLAAVCTYFINGSIEPPNEDFAFAKMTYETDVKSGDKILLQRNFLSAWPASKYKYLLKEETLTKPKN